MKATLLALLVSLPAVVTLAGPSDAANPIARVGGTSEGKMVLLASNGSDQQPTVGDEENSNPGQGKAKGKAKGHYKHGQESTSESAPAEGSKGAAGTSSTPALSAKELKAELDRHIRQVNTLDNNATAAKAGREAVARETGVSLSKLQTQTKDYKVETAGLLLANELAKATHKPAATFLKEHMEQNKDWDRICVEHKFDPSTVFPKFDRVAASMEATQKTKKK